jgi:hypothetical protein
MRRLLFSTAVLAGLTLISLLAVQGRGQDGEGGGKEEREEGEVRKGFAIAPLPLHFEPRDRNLVGLGSYIVNAQALCVDCHTNPQFATGGNPFLRQPKQVNLAGYLKGGKPFVAREGTGELVFSRNLRLENGRPAGLTLAQFVDVLRNGTDYDNHDNPGRLLQVMQWPVFQDMTDHDLLAIYAYLSALPPP